MSKAHSKSEERRRAIQETPEQKAARELVEGIAQNIERLANVVNTIINGRLKKHVLVMILARTAKVSQDNVEAVLNAIASMDKDNLK